MCIANVLEGEGLDNNEDEEVASQSWSQIPNNEHLPLVRIEEALYVLDNGKKPQNRKVTPFRSTIHLDDLRMGKEIPRRLETESQPDTDAGTALLRELIRRQESAQPAHHTPTTEPTSY